MKETAERMPIWEVCLQIAVDIIAKTNYIEQLPMETMGFPGGLTGKESTCNVGDLDSIPSLGRSPEGGHGNPLQYSCLNNPYGQRSLVGYSPWGHRGRHD